MKARHYDVIVLGRSIGALATAALLARREQRVLVLGQGVLPAGYRVLERPMLRRSFTLLSATSPAFRRVMQELAQTQRFRRLTAPLDPMFAVLDRASRFEVPPDVDLFTREIEREFREVHQPIGELYAEVSRVNGLADAVFEREAVWPPGSWLERLETGRLAGSLPLTGPDDPSGTLLDRLPHGHAFRSLFTAPAVFASHLGLDESALPEFALARLHGAWTRGVHSLPGGEQELEDFLVERIEAHGGVVRLRSRATELVVRAGKIRGVREDGDEEITGGDSVVSALTGEELAELSGGEGITRKAKDEWPHIARVGSRFVASIVVGARGVPHPLPTESFLLPAHATFPAVHLSNLAPEALLRGAATKPSETRLLVAEILLPAAGGLHPLGARRAILDALGHYLPFFEEHVELVDSPHDGLPIWRYEQSGKERVVRELDRVHQAEASPLAEPMQPRFEVRPRGYLGLAGEPVRGPLPSSYLVGPSVLPALGQEGELLAAWGVVRLLTRKDKNKKRLGRHVWTRFENG